MSQQILLWVFFNLFILAMLVLDLGVFHRKQHEIKVREALLWCAFWVSLALLFNVGIYIWKGKELALQFFAGYLLEESLSVDNLFVFLQIFTYFRVPALYQHTVLFWGILGVIILRAVFIVSGVVLIQKLHWIIYIFGAFLILTGIKMSFGGEKEIQPEKNPVIRLFRKFFPVMASYKQGKFFVKENRKIWATPLVIVLLTIELTDVLFAIDSIPAVLAISKDSFIVYSSNLFAVLGLRSIYFALAGMMNLFYYLKYGLSVILIFIGIKMLLESVVMIPINISLGVIVLVLFTSIIFSLFRKKLPA